MGWFLFLIVVIAIIAAFSAHHSEREKQKALEAYNASLSALKINPASSDVRQETLRLGRIYSNLVRDNKGNTIFDEVALMNDINAACAATQHVIQSQSNPEQQPESAESRLLKLNDLYAKRLIDQQDYLRRKQEIINSI